MRLYSQHARGVSLRAAVTCGTYKAGERGEVPSLDVSASYDAATKQIAVFIVNRSQTTASTVDIELADMQITRILGVDQLGGGDVKAANTWNRQDIVKPAPGTAAIIEGGGQVTIPAPGLAVVRAAVAAR
jgi:alpha-N-arabinofuranosidase